MTSLYQTLWLIQYSSVHWLFNYCINSVFTNSSSSVIIKINIPAKENNYAHIRENSRGEQLTWLAWRVKKLNKLVFFIVFFLISRFLGSSRWGSRTKWSERELRARKMGREGLFVCVRQKICGSEAFSDVMIYASSWPFSNFTHQREHHPAAGMPEKEGCRSLKDF